MKPRLRSFALSVLLLTAIIVGCQSLFDGGAGGAGGDGGTAPIAAAGDDATLADGFFPDGSHDVAGGGPPPTPTQEEEEGTETQSHFVAVQIDPLRESSAGPKFVLHFDIDNDGLEDLITGWNQSQPVQIHLQRRDADGKISFVTATLGGTGPIGLIGGLDMADFNGDGWLDVALLAKETGMVGICPTPTGDEPFDALDSAGQGEVQILLSPGNAASLTDGDAWQEVRFARSQLPGRRDEEIEDARTFPEFNGYSGITAGEIDGINGPDIVVAYNPAVCEFYGDDPDPRNRIVLYANPGGTNITNSGAIPLSAHAVATGPENVGTNAASVALDGTGSFTREGVSGFGPLFGNELTYSWTQTAGTAVTLSNPTTAQPTFDSPATASSLTFRLDVSAGSATDFDFVTVLVGSGTNLPPTVTASADQAVIPDVDNPGAVVVQLSAAGSDPDGGTLTYTWTQVAGAPVTLSGATTASPSFTAPTTGSELLFRVTVSDGTLFASDSVTVTSGFWAPVSLRESLARAGFVDLSDVDADGDNDIVFTFPNAITANVSWLRNPVDTVGAAATLSAGNWESRPIGHVDTEADVFTLGDIDMDGFDDVLVRSAIGQVVQWFHHPGAADIEPIFPPPDALPDRFNFPWQVFSVADFEIGKPAGIAIGDLSGDGNSDVIVAAGGALWWYNSELTDSLYGQWGADFVVDDTKEQGTTDDPNDPDFKDSGSVLYGLTVVDIDGDGANDVIATFDRRVISGLTDDTLIWFRNTLLDAETTP